jgi:hypothetical protein
MPNNLLRFLLLVLSLSSFIFVFNLLFYRIINLRFSENLTICLGQIIKVGRGGIYRNVRSSIRYSQ